MDPKQPKTLTVTVTDPHQELILQNLMDIKADVGGIRADLSNLKEAFTGHAEADASVEKRVKELEAVNEQHKGAYKLLSIIGAFIGAVLGAVASFLSGKFFFHN